jgi:hypothetical protein
MAQPDHRHHQRSTAGRCRHPNMRAEGRRPCLWWTGSHADRTRGTSRIAQLPIREPRRRKAAGHRPTLGIQRDPDWREGSAVKPLRLCGGRR